MKRLRTIASLFLLITITFTISVFAAAVPKPVMKANNSVLRIITSYSNGDMASGSGFVVAGDKTKAYIITNWHVAVKDDPAYISVILNAEAEINASVEASDESRDLAVLKVAMPLGMDPLKLNRESAGKGDGIYAIGFPGGADYLSDDLALNQEDTTITDGIVSAIRKATLSENGAQRELLQISAAINHGNSGGPVLNEKGNVVGVSTYFVSDATDINGAVSVVEVASFLQENGIPYSTAGGGMAFDPVLIAGVLAALAIILLGVLVVRRKKTAAAAAHTEQPVQETLNPYYETLMSEHINTAATTVKKTPFPLKKVAPAFAAIIVLGLAGMGFYGYSTVQKGLETGNINGVNPFFLQIARKTDKNLDAYMGAMELLDSGDFESAEQAFSDMGGYRDSDEMILESRYRKGKQLIKEGKFEEAKTQFSELGDYSDSADMIKEADYQHGIQELQEKHYLEAVKYLSKLTISPGYKDADIMLSEARYQQAMDQFEKKQYKAALKKFKELEKAKYQKAVDAMPMINSACYDDAVLSYRNGETGSASELFELLGSYKDAETYHRFCGIHTDIDLNIFFHSVTTSEAKSDVEFLLDNISFEDAGTLVLGCDTYAQSFLTGKWNSADGYYYFDMNKDRSIEYNLPDIKNGGTYNFDMGTLITKVNGNEYKEFIFEAIDRNTIDVFCYADRNVYTLYRN